MFQVAYLMVCWMLCVFRAVLLLLVSTTDVQTTKGKSMDGEFYYR